MHVVLNWGMGVDSSAILHRWLTEPTSRDFDLDRLVVVSAQTGDEFPDTQQAVETFALPLLRQHEVRYVQLARRGPPREDGVVVLDDTRQPSRLFREGAYKLSDELLQTGTVPQVASRRCSLKFKGWVIDTWLERFVRGPFRQVMGFNADEQARITRDSCYGGNNRRAEYPLMAWAWGRDRCEQYLRDTLGAEWPKSCCSFCPFTRGQEGVLARYARFPHQAADGLYLEHLSLALNPRMTLYAHGSLRDALAEDEDNDHTRAFALLGERLECAEWAVYRVRRLYHAKGRADRSTDKVHAGTRASATAALRRLAKKEGQPVERLAGSDRFWTCRRRDRYPAVEEMFVAAPADACEKQRGRFEGQWNRVTLRTVNL
jgi:hypothetical protein